MPKIYWEQRLVVYKKKLKELETQKKEACDPKKIIEKEMIKLEALGMKCCETCHYHGKKLNYKDEAYCRKSGRDTNRFNLCDNYKRRKGWISTNNTKET